MAVSTAYAHNPAFPITTMKDSTSSAGEPHHHFPYYRSAKIHLFLVIGSSLTLPKARVLLELNNFHVEKFGERVLMTRRLSKASTCSDDEDSEDEDINEILARQAESANEEAANSTSDTEEVDSKLFFSVPSTPRRTASFYTASASPSPEPPNTPSSGTSESSEESEESEHSSPETSLSEDQIATCDYSQGFYSVEDDSFRDCERVFSKALLKFGETLGFEDELGPLLSSPFNR